MEGELGPTRRTLSTTAADSVDPHRETQARHDVTPAIRTSRLSKKYGTVAALTELDFEVAPGETVGYLGPNGAGKTTTIRLLLGLHRPSGGQARLFGVDSWAEPVRAHRRVAYVAGEPFLWPSLTGEETLHFLAKLRGGVDTAYRDELVGRFQLDVKKKVRSLSKGNKQKVQLVAALATRADLLILDEPTAGLDPLMGLVFRECIHEAKANGQAVFLSSHVLSEVEEVADRVGILREGRLIDAGSLAELRHLSAQTVEVSFDGPAPRLPALPGVRVEEEGASTLRLEVAPGSIGVVVTELARHRIASFTSHEPSLEEIFLHHYGLGASGS